MGYGALTRPLRKRAKLMDERMGHEDGDAMSAFPFEHPRSSAVVPEALGVIVLPACPLLIVVRDPAEEGSGAPPPVGDAARPLAVLGDELPFLRATVSMRTERPAPAVEPAVVQARLEDRRVEMLDQITDRLCGP